MERKLLRERVIDFSREVLQLSSDLKTINQYVISNQLLKSATAIGALTFEAEQAETREDFIHKMKIALKEANETRYWLTIVEGLIKVSDTINEDLTVIMKIINRSIVTAKANRKR